nr:zinc finger, CCHC-type [Tanacetum cinerariifolium]
MNRHLLEVARALLFQMIVPKPFWADAVSTACFLINYMPSAVLGGNDPYSFLFPTKSLFPIDPKIFGRSDEHYKSVGAGMKIIEPSDVTFHEALSYFPITTYRHQEENDDLSDIIREPSAQLKYPPNDALNDAPNDVSNDVPISAHSEAYGKSNTPSDVPSGSNSPSPSPTPELDLPSALRKGKCTCRYPHWPILDEEINALQHNGTWALVNLPVHRKPIGCKWVFSVKMNPDGSVARLKARLVAKGYAQRYGIDYSKNFSPAAKISSIRLFISLGATYDWALHQLDVKNVGLWSFFEKQKLTRPNFIDWYRQLYLVLSTEDKENYLEHLIPAAPIAPPGQQVPPQDLAAHAAWVKGQKEVAELKAMYSKQAEQELLQTVREFHTSKQEESQSVSSHVLKMKGYIDNFERLSQPVGKGKMGHASNNAPFAPKPKTPPPPKKDNLAKGLRGSKKLKPGALSLYVGDGHRAAVEAIGTYHLELPSGLVIVLNNSHYAPSITRGVISVLRLFDDGFINCFDDNNVISVSKNNLVYFMAVSRDGIFEIDMSCSNTNDSFMYALTNKRAKINLDSSLLWHCRLGHISKKRIEKLQHDGLLNSIDIESLGKCVSCMSGKMARKPYSRQVERAKDLLGLIHTDLKHKHEVFETFKVFQKEVENQLGKTIKSLPTDRVDRMCLYIDTEEHELGDLGKPANYKAIKNLNAEFFESKLLDLKASGSVEDLELIKEEDTNPSVDNSLSPLGHVVSQIACAYTSILRSMS